MRTLVAIYVLGTSVFGAAAQSAELYSEHQFLTRERLLASQIQVRTLSASGVLTPFLQIGNDWLSRAETPFAPDAASYAHVAPGIQWRVGDLTARVETRFRAYYRPSAQHNLLDFRALAAWGAFHERKLDSSVSLFGEPYGEAVFTTADRNNLIATAFARGGLRFILARGLTLDAYAEPRAQWDRVRRPENHRLEGRLGARVTAQAAGLTFSGFAAALLTQNTLLGGPVRTGASFLFVVGGPL